MQITRRRFITGAAALTVGNMAPRIALATAPTDKRLVVVVLRGAMDGLSAVPPFGDPSYLGLRGSLAIDQPRDLDGFFGLHPALTPLDDWFRQGDLLPIHAVATPYRERSHFDGQDLLENGTGTPRGARDGWLGRLILSYGDIGQPHGLAIGQSVPLMLRGATQVTTWSPSILAGAEDHLLDKLAILYDGDPLFRETLSQALAMSDITGDNDERSGNSARAQFAESVRVVATSLAADDGPRIAVLDGASGWDTHANQGADSGRLANNLKGLAESLVLFRQTIGEVWSDTVVAVVTEFGRTAVPNGTNGTDHGTGGAMLLAGGAVSGGRVLADWPGLSNRLLLDARDLRPTLDSRSIFKGILRDHLNQTEASLAAEIFPESAHVRATDGLIIS